MRRILLTLLLLSLPRILFATEPTYLTGINIKPNTNSTLITFYLTKRTFGRLKYLPNISQVIVEFENTDKNFTLQNARLGGSNVKAITTLKTANGVLQFIFFVNGSVQSTIHFLPNDGSHRERLELNIISVEPEKKKTPVHKPNPSPPLKQTFSMDAKPVAKKPRMFTVVIDAGHGGRDPGARGIHGVEEKTVVLNIAKKLANEINRKPNMRAVLTRNGDYFVPLMKRLKLTRKDNADLFIAIHADAYFDNNATGASVYALSEHGASSVAARWLAQRENHSELGSVELGALQDQSPVLRSVLIDLAQTATTKESLFFGRKILHALDSISSLHYTHVERAPFLVLKSPDIPSILVEVGFISNPHEEQRLAEVKYQDQLAHALWLGINQYAKERAKE